MKTNHFSLCGFLFSLFPQIGVFSQPLPNNPDIIWSAETTFDITPHFHPSYYDPASDENYYMESKETNVLKREPNVYDNKCYCSLGETYFKISPIQTHSTNSLRVLLDFLADEAFNGTQTRYSACALGTPDFIQTLSDKEFFFLTNKSDTVFYEDPSSGKMRMEILKQEMSKSSFSAVKVNQEWNYDQKQRKVIVRVTDVGLSSKRFNHRGEFLGIYALCFFKFRTPDLRPCLRESMLCSVAK